MAVLASNPHLRCCFGQVSTAQVNVGTTGGWGTTVLDGETRKAITTQTKAAACVITSTAYVPTGTLVTISGSNMVPSIDGSYVATNLTYNTFSIPLDTSGTGYTAGTAGFLKFRSGNGRILTIVDATVRAIGGNASGLTLLTISDTSGVANYATFTMASLTQNALVRAGASGAVGTYLGTALPGNTGIKIGKTGGSLATATAVDYWIWYIEVNA
jgi:hypothetical protein